MTTWKEIISKPGWGDLDLATKQEVRNQWISEDVAPTLADDPDRDAVLNELYNEPLDTGEGLARSMFGSAARGFLDPLAAVPEVAGAYTGIDSLEELGSDIRSGIESTFPVNPAQQGILTDVAGVAGQVGQIAATGGLGAAGGMTLAGKAATKAAQLQAARFGATAAQQGAMGASAVAGGLERADQLGLEGGDRLVRGLLAGGTELATEKLGGFATELGPVNKLLGDSIESGFMKPVIRGILTEAGEEGAAETVGQATDIAMAPEIAPAMDLKQIGYSMLLGGVGGAMFGGVEAAIAPKTAQAYKDSGAFVPVRNIADLPADIDPNDDANLVYDSRDNLIGYKPKAQESTVEGELPYEELIEINVDENLPADVRPEVEAMVANVAETPETSATAAALAEDTQSGIYDLGEADVTANLLTGIPMQRPLGGEQQFDNAQFEGQPIEEDQATLEQQQPIESDVPLTQEALQQEQSSVEAVPQSRELPILPAEPTAQAPEAAVTDQEQLEPNAAVAPAAVTEREAGADAAQLEQQWQDSPQFAAAEEAAAAGDMERADAIEAGWRAGNQQVSPEPTGAVPTESLPAGQPMSGDMGAAVAPEKPTKGMSRKDFLSGMAAKVKQATATQGALQTQDATPTPPQQQQPDATPAAQETQPEAATFATQQPATEAQQPVEDPIGYGNALIALFPSLQKAGVTAISIEEAMKRLDAEWEKKQASGKATRLDQLVYMANKKNTQSALDGANIGGIWTRTDKTVAVSSKATPSAMAHEIGHAIMELEYANAPEATRKAIEAEYAKWFAAKYGKDGVPSVADQRRIWEWMTDADWMNPDAPFPQDQRVAKWEAYRSKFSEWFADEVAKWAATKDAPKSLVDKFFSELAQKLKKLWDAVRGSFSPNETLASWLDSISVASPAKEQQPAEETGDAGVTQQRPLSRSKPREAIVFKKPIKTPLGNVIGYSWSNQIIEDVDKDGEAIFRRISNWDEAANNAETGRDIVHRFQIQKPDGTTSEVSLESTLGKMTAGDKKTVKAVISAAKRLPFMRAELAELKDLQAAAKADYDRSRTLKPNRSKLELREPDAKWLRERNVKQAYLDGVFLENVEAGDLTESGEIKNQYKFWNDNTWRWQGAQIKVQFTDSQKARMESLERSIKKAESLLKDQDVTISPEASGETPDQAAPSTAAQAADATASGPSQQSASERLRADIATLPVKAQAAWTPELLAVADSYYSSGDKKLLDSLTAVQRKRVYANASTAAEQAAYEAAQKAAFALRNPPAATYADAANDPNVLIDSLGEEQLQQAITIRESKQDEPENRKGAAADDRGTIQQIKGDQSAGAADGDVPKGQQRGVRKGSGVERRNSILRQNDGSILRTGVTQRAAEAARNSYDGVIPGVADTWLGTAAEFQEQHPDGIDWGDGKLSQPDADVEAGVAADGRSYVFIDRVQLLEGDVKRAEQYGTTPQGEAVKRLLRHESFGHRGAMSLPAPLRNRFVDMIASGVIPEAELDYIVNERGYSNYAGWRNDIAKQIMLAEEWLAHKMEGIRAIPQSGPMAQMMDWLRDVWAWLTGAEKAMLPELRDMMREMHRALGALKPQQRVVDGTRASLQQSPLDAEYLAAIEAGDMEKAQRMVDEAARGAGFTERYNHGTPNTDFTVFNLPDAANTGVARMGPGIYGAVPSDTQTTETYARNGRVIPMYVNMENVAVGDKLSETQVSDMLSVLDADMTLRDGNKVGRFVDQYRSSDSLNELWGLFQLTQPEKWYEAVNKAGIEGATRFSAGVENGEIALFKQNKVKDASPVTYDSSGAIIPLSQRFQSTSNDIRYSRQGPAKAQVDELTINKTKQRSQANQTLAEYEFLPDEYYLMAEKGKVDEAVTAYAIEKTKPYTKSAKGLLELRDILLSDRAIYDTFGIGATTGQAGLDYITAEAALAAEKLGNPILAETFMRINTAIGTSKGQALAVRGLWVNNPRYSSLMAVSMIDRTAEEGSKKVTDKKLGAVTAGKVEDAYGKATEDARDATADAAESEILISDKVLELGAAVQGNPKLTDKIKTVIQNVIDRGNAMRALQKIRNAMRASIIPDSSKFDKMTEAELEAEIARLEGEIAADIDFIEKETAKKPKAPKEAKPIETAKAIIARVQKKAASETIKTKPKLDRVRVLYKSHLRERMDEAKFNKEAIGAGLDAKTAKELYDAAELEIAAILLSKEVSGRSENYDKLTKERLKHLDVDTSALTGLVDKLRREGKIGPLRWRDIMQLPATRQQIIKGTLLDLIKANPQLENLTADEQTQLAEALETVWENERERQFKLQVKRMELAGVAKADAEKLVDSVPRILKLINQGMLTEPAFYKAYGEQFGINGVSDKDRERIMELSAKVYDNPSTSATAKDKQEIVDLLQKYHKLSAAEVLSNVWVAHVLSGVRTQSEMAMGISNGLLSTVKKGIDIIARNRDVESVKAAGAGLGAFFRGLGDGFMQAARYVYTEEPGLIRSDMENINSYLENGVSKGGISTGRKLRQSENKLARGLGQWLSILERVTTGWDVINYRATYEGTLAMVHKMNPKIYNAALLPTQKDREALRERARAVLGPKATPTQISSMVFSDIQDGIHLLGKNLEESAMFEWKKMAEDFTYDAKESAYMVDPTGLGGVFYHGIMSAAQGATAKAKKLRDDSQKELDREGKIGAIEYAFRKVFPPLLYLMAAQSRNIFGVRFIRFTGNKINELISYIPAVGLARIAFEKGMYRDGEMTIKARNVFMNNMIGISLVTLALTKGIEDLDEEDEERGYIVNGPWDNLTPARKSQLMADGFKPNTIAFYDKKTGKWNSWNYISWPSAGILATLGSVSDYKRFTPEKWNDKMLASKIMSGVYAGGSSFMDISSISQMTELFGRSTYSTDPADKGLEKVTRLASGYLGGFVPRLFKDVDSMMDSSAYKPEKSWEHFAKEMPYLRRSVGAPLRDIFYEKVNVSRTPWSRAFQQSPDDPAYKKLARLNAKGIWLTPPNPENRKVRRGGATRALTEDEAAAYMSETGAKYKEFIMKRGDMLAKMDVDRAAELIEKTTARIREIALKRAIARSGKAVTVEAE